jgi:hypothetical protein
MTQTNLIQCQIDSLRPVGRVLKRPCSECGGPVRVEASGLFCQACGLELYSRS